MTSIEDSLARVKENIAAAAVRSGRQPEDVTLVAVTKAVPVERIREVIRCGQLDLGENRAHEAVAKHEAIGDDVRWHFVGTLQRNKVRAVIGFTDLLHSMDRVALAEEIQRRAPGPREVLVEVNVSGERTKAGVSPDELPALLARLEEFDRLAVTGLMTMAPAGASTEQVRDVFRRAAGLKAQMRARFPEMGIHHLSMGMSQDYEVAIEESATIVRVGEAIFGPRPV